MMTHFDVHSYLEELSATIQELPLQSINDLVRVFLQAYDPPAPSSSSATEAAQLWPRT